MFSAQMSWAGEYSLYCAAVAVRQRVQSNCAWLIDCKLTHACPPGFSQIDVGSPCNSIIVLRQTTSPYGPGRPGRVSHTPGRDRNRLVGQTVPRGNATTPVADKARRRRERAVFPRVRYVDKFSCREADVVRNNYRLMLNVRSHHRASVRLNSTRGVPSHQFATRRCATSSWPSLWNKNCHSHWYSSTIRRAFYRISMSSIRRNLFAAPDCQSVLVFFPQKKNRFLQI